MRKYKSILPGLVAGLVLACILSLWHISAMWRAEAAFLDWAAAILVLAPEQEQEIIAAMKKPDPSSIQKGYDILLQYGYQQGEAVLLRGWDYMGGILLAVALAFCAGFAILLLRYYEIQCGKKRIAALSEYLAQINNGEYSLRPKTTEDMLSPLEDELYKTVVLLREGREQAVSASRSLADNLADIAHQLKTPLSSITLLADMHDMPQIASQAEKMTSLVSALLALSRIDAGTLTMEQKQVDVEELCRCAADVVLPLFYNTKISLCLPDTNATYIGDMGWSIQALVNILKNCFEHIAEDGKITVTAEENPIYTAIYIEDDGPGIPVCDLPHLFERFYCGKHAKRNSVGLGLALSKALIGAQNGILTAENQPGTGARFMIKFYHNS